jgi:S1-C subfamily serine protease
VLGGAVGALMLVTAWIVVLGRRLREQMNLPRTLQGVAVTELARGGQAAQEGLRVNDIILEVNRKPVASMRDYTQATKSIKPDDSVLFLIQRDGNTFYRAFRVRK